MYNEETGFFEKLGHCDIAKMGMTMLSKSHTANDFKSGSDLNGAGL